MTGPVDDPVLLTDDELDDLFRNVRQIAPEHVFMLVFEAFVGTTPVEYIHGTDGATRRRTPQRTRTLRELARLSRLHAHRPIDTEFTEWLTRARAEDKPE